MSSFLAITHLHPDEESIPVLQQLNRKLRIVWQRNPAYHLQLLGKSLELKVLPTDSWPGSVTTGRKIIQGFIPLGDETIALNDLWHKQSLTKPQLAQLHCFEWLRDLRAVSDNSARRLTRQIILDWIEHHQSWRSIAWRPDIIGHRLSTWLGLYDFFGASADERFKTQFFKSVTRQLKHLVYTWQDVSSSLQRLWALHGLITASIAFDFEIYRLPKYLQYLDQLLEKQILPDGGHISGIPMVQLIVLRQLIDLRTLLRLIKQEISGKLQQTITKMAPVLRLFRHGDGGLADFGANFRIPSSLIDMVLSLADAHGRPPLSAPHIGVERCLTKSGLILVKTSPSQMYTPYPTLEPGTGIFHFEWSVGKQRIFTFADIVLQTTFGDYLSADELQESHSQVQRHVYDKSLMLETCYQKQTMDFFFNLQRYLYLDGNTFDFRGEEVLHVAVQTAFAIRFILAPQIEINLLPNGRGLILNLPTGHSWRMLVSGVREILTETLSSYDQRRQILLMGQLQADKQHLVRWAIKDIS
jgi:uncharacterized heparinase superfamily protein